MCAASEDVHHPYLDIYVDMGGVPDGPFRRGATTSRFNYHKGNLELTLNEMNWSLLKETRDVEVAFDIFLDSICVSVPIKASFEIIANYPSWSTRRTIDQIER